MSKMAAVLTREESKTASLPKEEAEIINFIDPSLAADQKEYYKKVFSPDTIKSQIISLCSLLGVQQPDLRKINTLPLFPANENVTGFAVVIDYRFLNENYSLALQKLLKLISQKGIGIRQDMNGRIVGQFHIDPLTKKCLDMCPSFGPFKIFPISTGHKRLGCSAQKVREEIREAAAKGNGEWIEFPINSLNVLSLFASHSNRMIQRDSILPLCLGDICSETPEESSNFIPMIDKGNAGREFKLVYDGKTYSGIERGHYSAWTGFVKRKGVSLT